MKRWYAHRTVVFLACIVLGWAVWSGVSSVQAERKIDAGVRTQMRAGGPVTMWVDLPFRAEEFHIRYMQERGTVTGVAGNRIALARVAPPAVWTIARQYWVERVSAKEP